MSARSYEAGRTAAQRAGIRKARDAHHRAEARKRARTPQRTRPPIVAQQRRRTLDASAVRAGAAAALGHVTPAMLGLARIAADDMRAAPAWIGRAALAGIKRKPNAKERRAGAQLLVGAIAVAVGWAYAGPVALAALTFGAYTASAGVRSYMSGRTRRGKLKGGPVRVRNHTKTVNGRTVAVRRHGRAA